MLKKEKEQTIIKIERYDRGESFEWRELGFLYFIILHNI